MSFVSPCLIVTQATFSPVCAQNWKWTIALPPLSVKNDVTFEFVRQSWPNSVTETLYARNGDRSSTVTDASTTWLLCVSVAENVPYFFPEVSVAPALHV